MGWENRNGRQYYYFKRRLGQQVVSEYIGSNDLAKSYEIRQKSEIERRELERKVFTTAIMDYQALESEIRDVHKLIQSYVQVKLLLAGYRNHKGEWRRKRYGS